jgi:hypothetical protein
MTVSSWLWAAALAAILIAPGAAVAERVSLRGVWLESDGGHRTGYAGSSVRFDLTGAASIQLRCTKPESLHVRVTVGDAVLHDGRWTGTVFRVSATARAVRVTATLIATRDNLFPRSPGTQTFGELVFTGVEADDHSTVTAIPDGCLVDFIGDSITAGVSILGRDGDETSDASLSFGYLVGTDTGFSSRIRGYSGARTAELSQLYPWAAPGIPLPQQPSPHWVVVNCGANDRNLAGWAYRRQIEELVTSIISTHPTARIVLLNFFRMTPNRLPILREIAARDTHRRVFVFDARPHLVDYSDGNVHPGPDSHRRLGIALAAFLRNNSRP